MIIEKESKILNLDTDSFGFSADTALSGFLLSSEYQVKYIEDILGADSHLRTALFYCLFIHP